MKRHFVLFCSLIVTSIAFAQLKELPDNKILADNADKTLKAANTMCILSFISQAAGAGLILAGYDMSTDSETTMMFFGLNLGIGGVGMATNNAILTSRAYKQIRMLSFAQEDSSLRMKMLNNIKLARTLSIIQNITPIVGVAAGVTGYLISKPGNNEAFFESSSFWIPAISICSAGLLLTIPEIVLISKTQQVLNSYRQKITLGATSFGMGISYKF